MGGDGRGWDGMQVKGKGGEGRGWDSFTNHAPKNVNIVISAPQSTSVRKVWNKTFKNSLISPLTYQMVDNTSRAVSSYR